MFQLFVITGRYTPYKYYGYCDADADVMKEFLWRSASSNDLIKEKERGDLRLIAENNHDRSSLECETLAVYETEEEAFIARNDQRASDPLSISGVTRFPYLVSARAVTKQKAAEWDALQRAKSAVIAGDGIRELYSLDGARFHAWFPRATLKEVYGEQVKNDLKELTFLAFCEKYHLNLKSY